MYIANTTSLQVACSTSKEKPQNHRVSEISSSCLSGTRAPGWFLTFLHSGLGIKKIWAIVPHENGENFVTKSLVIVMVGRPWFLKMWCTNVKTVRKSAIKKIHILTLDTTLGVKSCQKTKIPRVEVGQSGSPLSKPLNQPAFQPLSAPYSSTPALINSAIFSATSFASMRDLWMIFWKRSRGTSLGFWHVRLFVKTTNKHNQTNQINQTNKHNQTNKTNKKTIFTHYPKRNLNKPEKNATSV